MPTEVSEAGRFKIWLLLLLFLSGLLIFYNLGSNSLHNGDEAKFAFVSQEMLKKGDWLTPHIEGKPYFGKPPLKFWLTAILFSVFGASEWMIRFWSAAAALGCILFTALLGRKIYGETEGILAGLGLATCIQFLYEHSAKSGEMDAMLLFFLTSSLYFLLAAEERPSLLYLSFFLMGLASLTKNFAGFVPLGIGTLYLLIGGRWRNYRLKRMIVGLSIFAVVSFAWMAAMIAVHGHQFIESFIYQQALQRITESEYSVGVREARGFIGNSKFLAKTILYGLFPWSLFLLPALASALTKFERKSLAFLPLCWFLSFLLGMYFFKNKLYWYLLPLYPAAFLLTGKFLTEVIRDKFHWRTIAMAMVFAPGLLLLRPNGLHDPFMTRAVETAVETLQLRWPIPSSWIAATAMGVVFIVILTRIKTPIATRALLFTVVAYASMFVLHPMHYSNHRSDVNQLTMVISENARGAKNALYIWRLPRDIFYPSYPLFKPGNIARWYFHTIPRTRIDFIGNNIAPIKNLLQEGGNKLFLMPAEEYVAHRNEFVQRLVAIRNVRGRFYAVIASKNTGWDARSTGEE